MARESDLQLDRESRGLRAIRLHPDLPSDPAAVTTDDLETCAADIIADVLHALRVGLTCPPAPGSTLSRAERTFYGDLEER